MTLFYALAVLTAAAVVVAGLLPLWRAGQRGLGITLMAVAAAVGLGTHVVTSNYDPAMLTRAGGPADIRADLEARLERAPNDVAALRLLGRWHMQQESFGAAVAVYERAYAASDRADPEVMLDFAEALAALDPASIGGRAGQLVENALKLSPSNGRALWYGGSIAAGRGDRELAAERWEAMLQPDMPPEVRDILETRIAEMRGEAPPAAAALAATDGVSLRAAVSVAEDLQHAVDGAATLYLIAGTGRGGPPIAVARYGVGELPGELTISDANAMLPGRSLGGEERIVLTARISQSGEPIAQPGDLYGETGIELPAEAPAAIVIDRVVSAQD